jgi:hypothetical protein
MKILQRETIDEDDDYINELQFDEKNDESMEKSTCCFGTGISRRYELTINNDYFTPPTKSFSQPFWFKFIFIFIFF